MLFNNIDQVYFSPTESTKHIVKMITKELGTASIYPYDLMKEPLISEVSADQESVTIVGMPVYAGRIPGLCVDMVKKLKGNGQPAIAVVVYGNRDYDDALLELKDLLESCGFVVIAAGAFIAKHSIFPTIASDRPDDKDELAIAEFSKECKSLIKDFKMGESSKIEVKGNKEYKTETPIPLVPTGDRRCNQCGACVKVCPTHSIGVENPRKTKEDTCIHCAACIHICPTGARKFRGLKYKIAGKKIAEKCKTYRLPEVFYYK